MLRYLLLCGALLASALLSFTTPPPPKYPQADFRSPVDHPIRLSGTFGELRSNHFHAGIDIKSARGASGDIVRAIADGYVSRIKVEAAGYGNVIYLTHPNGYTSVYAHLDKFMPEIREYVKRQQMASRRFGQDLTLDTAAIRVEQGQEIGRMGNSGYSFGPHLHFEIRNTRTERIINPLLFGGIEVVDRIPPKLHQLRLYQLNDKRETIGTRTFDIKKGKYGYYITSDTVALAAWRIGAAIKTYDHMNGAPNWNGVYDITMRVDGEPHYQYTMETYAFDETRYINAHLDYHDRVKRKSYFNRMYRLPGNQLSTYPTKVEDGVVNLYERQPRQLTFTVSDANGNSSEVSLWVRRDAATDPPVPERTYQYYLPHDERNVIENSGLRAEMQPGTFYQDLYLRYFVTPDESPDLYSNTYHLHEYTEPVHRWYTLALRPTDLPDSLRSKALIAYCSDPTKGTRNMGGTWEGDYLTTQVRGLGEYVIQVDVTPPRVQPVTFKRNMRGYNLMSFKVTDDLPTSRRLEDFDWEGRIDGEWVLFEYDAKNDLLTHRFEPDLPSGEHDLLLTVTDERGNTTEYRRAFVR